MAIFLCFLKSHPDSLTKEQVTALTWMDFKVKLHEQFIPETYQIEKEAKFLNLKQGHRDRVGPEVLYIIMLPAASGGYGC